jgi:2-oxoglutarate ferredoxin oxidoreductase subunit gamma
MPQHEIVFSGSGGQGLMFIGKLLAKLAMDDYEHVTFFPSYGAEVRGGTSNCQVILSEKPIASPLVEHATAEILMNQPSVDRFLPSLAEGGRAYFNSSMASSDDSNAVPVPASEIALDLGSVQAANVVIFAAFLSRTNIIGRDKALRGILDVSKRKGEKAVDLNRRAFEKGWELLSRSSG